MISFSKFKHSYKERYVGGKTIAGDLKDFLTMNHSHQQSKNKNSFKFLVTSEPVRRPLGLIFGGK